MKKFHSFFLLLMCILLGNVYAQAVQLPEAGKKYVIVHSSGFVLAENGSTVKIDSPSGSENQEFELVAVDGVEGAYTLKLESTGRYLTHDTQYTPVWTDDPSQSVTHFIIENVDDTYIKFRNAVGKTNDPAKAYLGTDANSMGSGVYCDKVGNDGKHYWKLQESTFGLAKQLLEESIEEAQTLFAESTPGEDVGQYPPAAMDALQTAITAAESAVPGTVDEQVAARNALLAAITTFKGAKIAIVIKEGIDYYIQHTSSLFFTKEENAVKIIAPSGAAEQKVRFVPVDGQESVYYIQMTLEEIPYYMAKYDRYKLNWLTTTSGAGTFKFEVGDEGYLKIKFTDTNLGPGVDDDSPASGASVWADKNGSLPKYQWKLIEVDPNAIFTEYLAIMIEKAQVLADESPVGDEGHQWPQAAVDVLNTAIGVANEALGTATTQEQVNAAVGELTTAIADFQAAKILPMLNPKEGEKYRYSIAKYAAKYLNNTEGSTSKTADFAAADENQLWEMVKVEGTANQFILKQGNQSLTDAWGMETYDPSTSVKFTLQYIRTSDGIDYYGALTPAGKVMTFGSGTTGAFQDFVATNNAHWGIFTRANLPNDPNITSLRAYVPTAETQLASKKYGTESGLWSIESKDVLTLMIGKAKEILNGSGNTQEEVDLFLDELKEVVKWHDDQMITVILDELNVAIEEAVTAKDAAVVGTRQGEYYQSVIDAFVSGPIADANAALKLSIQEEVDAATTAIREATQVFIAAAHTGDVGVEQVLQEAISSAEAFCQSVEPGIHKGDYPAAAIEEFAAAIETAKNASVTQETLDALLAARAKFEDSKLTVDRSTLATAITAAKKAIDKEVGDFNGQVSQVAKDAYQTAINTAETAYPNLALTQEEIDAVVTVLKTAGETFTAAVIVIDFSALKQALSAAEATLKGAEPEKGEGPGTYPESAFTALQTAIDAAKAVNGSTTVNQATVDAAAQTMGTAETVFKAARVPNDYTELETKIAEAEDLIANTPIGDKPGEVAASYATKLQATLDECKLLLESTSQTAIETGVKSLNKDISLFRNAIVPDGLSSVELDEMGIFAANGTLFVQKLPADAAVTIYTTGGQLVKNVIVEGAFEIALDPATYILKVQTGSAAKTIRVAVN